MIIDRRQDNYEWLKLRLVFLREGRPKRDSPTTRPLLIGMAGFIIFSYRYFSIAHNHILPMVYPNLLKHW